VTSGAISKRIDRLAAAGLVRRSDDAADKRSWSVELTKSGVVAADSAMTEIAVMWQALAAVAGMSKKEIGRLDSDLRQLLERMPAVTALAISNLAPNKKEPRTNPSGN
jgi:DNA-binding MarR family transcriptional regulator